jgi:hypothetical protein
MKKTLLCMALSMLLGASAQASLIDNLTLEGDEDIFSNSATFGMAINFNSTGAGNGAELGVGDVVFNITSIVNQSGNRVITISSLEVVAPSIITPPPPGVLTFGAVGSYSGSPVGNLINAAYSTGRTGSALNTDLFAGLNHSDLNLANFATALGFSPSVVANIAPNAAFLVLSSNTAVNPLQVDVQFAGNGDRSDLNGLSILTNPSLFGPANYSLDLVGGFNTGDFYEVQVTDPAKAQLGVLRHDTQSANILNPNYAPGTPSPTVNNGFNSSVFASATGGFSSLWNNFGPGIILNPISVTNSASVTSTHQIGLTGGALSTIANAAGAGPSNFAEEYMYGGSVNFNINPTMVPEPASMLIWASLSLAGIAGFRRRKTA